MILQKRVLFVAAFLVNCLVFSQVALADQHEVTGSAANAYYSSEFLEDIKHLKNQELKKSILTTFKKHQSIGYDSAKVFLMGNFYLINDNNHYSVKDVYCAREIGEKEFPNGKSPAPNKVPDNEIINTEHTWPQSRFNGNLNKGIQKADLHHLFPTDSKINNIRGNFKFGEVQKDSNVLKCHGPRIGTPSYSSERVFEPPQDHKGNVARALFYFSIKYNLAIDPNEETVLRRWSSEDPVDEEEMLRNDEIEKIQHSRNPFIDFPELATSVNDY